MQFSSALRKATTLGIGLIATTSLILVGCGGGSGGGTSTPAPSSLGGVTAVGYPIVSGTVQVKCASGPALNTTTSSTGSWQVILSGGQTLPCAIEVSGGTINNVANNTSYHSVATVAGIINVTPLTDLMVANLVAQTLSTWFAGLNTSPALFTAITQANVDTALTNLRTALSGLAPLNTINPITTSFTATPGNISDDMLAALQSAITNSGGSYTYSTLLNAASTTSFTTVVAALNAALPAAYAATTSGSLPSVTGIGPGITGVFPTSSAPSASVTISGTNFSHSASNYRVSFNGVTASPWIRTLYQLAVNVPAGATTGTLTVTDLTNGQVYNVPGGFTVL